MVTNSFDPNDKTCLGGDTGDPSMAGKFVHYLIRFENTGTANAHNIVVKDVIDTTKFYVSSLIPLDGSHPFDVTQLAAGTYLLKVHTAKGNAITRFIKK